MRGRLVPIQGLILLGVFSVACSPGPEDTVRRYFQALSSGDTATIAETATERLQMVSGLGTLWASQEGNRIEEVEVSQVEYRNDGEWAVVDVRIHLSDGVVEEGDPAVLQQTSEGWKVTAKEPEDIP